MARNPALGAFAKRIRRHEEEIRQQRLREFTAAIGAFIFDLLTGAITTNPDATSLDINLNDGDITFTNVNSLDVGSAEISTDFGIDLRSGADLTLYFKASNQTVTSGSTSLAVSFSGLSLVDEFGTYNVQVTPHWDTTVWVTSKANSGFTINFGTAPGSDSSVDWIITR